MKCTPVLTDEAQVEGQYQKRDVVLLADHEGVDRTNSFLVLNPQTKAPTRRSRTSWPKE